MQNLDKRTTALECCGDPAACRSGREAVEGLEPRKRPVKAALRISDDARTRCLGGAGGGDLGRPVPRKQLVDALGGVVLQAPKDVGEPGAGIDVVELTGLDQGVDRGGAAAAGVGAGEGPVLAADGDAAHGALGGVVKGMMLLAPRLDGEKVLSWIPSRSRDRGVGSTKRWQAVLTMSCELELLHGRPYDLPGCAASADP